MGNNTKMEDEATVKVENLLAEHYNCEVEIVSISGMPGNWKGVARVDIPEVGLYCPRFWLHNETLWTAIK